MREPTDYERRVASTQLLLEGWKGQAFAWGTHDCARLADAAMLARGRSTRLPEAQRYRSLRGAVSALKRLGYADLPAALDAHALTRIPPAAALPGDLIALPGEGGMPALTVALGLGRVLGFHSGVAEVLAPNAFVAAWRT